MNEAEKIKLTHGSVIPDTKGNETYITIQGLSGTKPREVSVGFIAEVLNARADELIGVVKEIIAEKSRKLVGWFVSRRAIHFAPRRSNMAAWIMTAYQSPARTIHRLGASSLSNFIPRTPA